jgi:hypothetical protein
MTSCSKIMAINKNSKKGELVYEISYCIDGADVNGDGAG